MIQLIAFLGNYGREYENTRHNVAWLFEKSLPFSNKISWQSKYKSDFYSVDFDVLANWLKDCQLIKERSNGTLPIPEEAPKKIYFMKPMTYMNLSGDAIGEASRFLISSYLQRYSNQTVWYQHKSRRRNQWRSSRRGAVVNKSD